MDTKVEKDKSILFKIWKFPRLSETFILAQIITAIKCGFRVNILIEDLMDIEESTHGKLIKEYRIEEKIIFEDYKIPKNNILRYFKSCLLILVNLPYSNKLILFLQVNGKFQINNIYKFHFFRKFRHFDIVHVQYGTNGKPLDLLKKINFFPPKLIVSFHGHDLYFPINGLIQNNNYYHELFDNSDLLVANTPYLNNLLQQLGAPINKIKNIPVSVNSDFFKPLISKKKFNSNKIEIITVGRLEVFKGQKFGIECVKIMKEKGYNVFYTIVGDGSQDKVLKRIIYDYGLEENILLTGRKSQEEIRDLLQISDIFLMTSITDPDYGVESQGLVTAEAQACGLPVVAFDSGGVKYTIDDGNSGFIVPEFDVNLMAKKIEILINNPDLRHRMGIEAVKWVRNNFSNQKVDQVWSEIYNM